MLTKDEAANVADCLGAVCAQLRDGDEVLLIDSASRDATVAIAQGFAPGVRVHASRENMSFGVARNMGVALAKHDVIVFLSADAVPEACWLDGLRRSIENADIVYGRQRHAPTTENLATVSRGLRYRHFEQYQHALPESYASNVNAAYRRFAFRSLCFDEDALGAEDVAFAKAARLAGLRLAYAPKAVVGHRDVATVRAEWRKLAREGEAHAQLRRLLGTPTMHIAWACGVAGLALTTVITGRWWVLIPTLVVFFAPTLRRLLSPGARQYRAWPLLGAAAASPFFDLVFLGSYVKRRVIR
ncbi:MAG: glycosyltransferase family 2 protein [Candidatus Thermoplasmatota archaeon]